MARTAAQRSAVLLRNEGDLLPLTSPGSIAVIGPLADSRRDTLGPWVFDYDLAETVTVLQGIQERAGQGVEVSYAPGIRPAQRTFPSMFDMWGDNAPSTRPDSTTSRTGTRRYPGAGCRRRGGGPRRVAEHDR